MMSIKLKLLLRILLSLFDDLTARLPLSAHPENNSDLLGKSSRILTLLLHNWKWTTSLSLSKPQLLSSEL
jgi:hypothetical protein